MSEEKKELNEEDLNKVTGGYAQNGAKDIRNNVIYSVSEAMYISAIPKFLNKDIVIFNTYNGKDVECGTVVDYKDTSGNGTAFTLTFKTTCPYEYKGNVNTRKLFADNHRICEVKGYR